MNRRAVRKFLVIDSLILVAVVSMFVAVKSQKRDAFTFKGEYKTLSLAGKWYRVELDTVHTFTMTKDGNYTEEDENGNKLKSGKYKIGNHALKIDDSVYSMNYVDEKSELQDRIKDDLSQYEFRKYFYTIDKNKEKIYYFSNKVAAADQVEDNCSVNEYYAKIGLFDEGGFAIDGDGRLLAYTGEDSEVTIPKGVREISENAMASDYQRALNTDSIIIPENVKKIDSGAFSFSRIKKVYIEEGVEEIDHWAFGDSFIEEIHFPYEVKNMQPGILDTEEGLEALKIYCKENSPVDTYFKDNPPQGKYEIVYE